MTRMASQFWFLCDLHMVCSFERESGTNRSAFAVPGILREELVEQKEFPSDLLNDPGKTPSK